MNFKFCLVGFVIKLKILLVTLACKGSPLTGFTGSSSQNLELGKTFYSMLDLTSVNCPELFPRILAHKIIVFSDAYLFTLTDSFFFFFHYLTFVVFLVIKLLW